MSSSLQVVPLACASQNYDWGKLGLKSTVAQLLKASQQSVSQSKRYAELWMGTHPSAPSQVILSGTQPVAAALTGGAALPSITTIPLSQYIASDSAAADAPPTASDSTATASKPPHETLPFLLKILSIDKALSIQAHPSKAHAEQLHRTNPKEYKDANHKPELACALTEFEAMCGFRRWQQIVYYVNNVPELAACLGSKHVAAMNALSVAPNSQQQSSDECKSTLRAAYTALMTCNAQTMQEQLAKLIARIQKSKPVDACPEPLKQALDVYDLMLRLSSQYPGDVGIFSPLLLNAFVMHPGQAMYLPPNEPHAYLSGDCVECMACSDNVVRAGLTPKFKDTAVLCEMLTYNCGAPILLTGNAEECAVTRGYHGDAPEFELYCHTLSANLEEHAAQRTQLEVLHEHSILIVTQGTGTMRIVDDESNTRKRKHSDSRQASNGNDSATKQTEFPLVRGAVFFVPRDTMIELHRSQSESSSPLQVFQCAQSKPGLNHRNEVLRL